MHKPQDIAISDYDYPLPSERIAKFPLSERDESKLLVYKAGQIGEHRFKELVDYLSTDTLLVFNNTKVIHARIFFRKATGSIIEIFCLEPWQCALSEAFEQRNQCEWKCFVGNNKRWKSQPLEQDVTMGDGHTIKLTAHRKECVGEAWIVRFEWEGCYSFAEIMEQVGVIPLPPYLHREAESSDNERYQTVYAEHTGSVAAPTAGLHFTDSVFQSLKQKSILTEFITLHVGAGTFKPVSSDTIGEHEMHTEQVSATRENIERILEQEGKPVIAVGTTTVRTLESLYWFGVKLQNNPDLQLMHIEQWEPYELEQLHVDGANAYRNILKWMERRDTTHIQGSTQLMIAPGYRYHIIDGIVTNFHQPKSTLLLLVSALIGDHWKTCYQYALDHQFRFLSYGDSCLFLPN